MNRIAIVVPKLSGGGAEFVASEWARSLKANGWGVTIIMTHAASTPSSTDLDEVRLTATAFPTRVSQLRRALQVGRFDIVLALMPHWNVLTLLASRGTGTPVVISGRNVESGLLGVHGLSLRAEMALAKVLYKRAAAYIAISHPVAAEAIVKYALQPDRVWVVPNPATAKVSTDRAGRAKHRPPEEGRSITLTIPARIVAQKRPTLAIDVAAVLRGRGHSVDVEFFGDGKERAQVAAHALRLGVPTTFHGWVERWFDSCADDAVVVLPSTSEGFGNVLVEAAAAGIPSVASSRALGVADAIVPGLSGELAIDSSPDSLADAVERAHVQGVGDVATWLSRFSPVESGRSLSYVLNTVVVSRKV